jgi:hypothetical protein
MNYKDYFTFKALVTANFFVSVVILVTSGLLALTDYSLFEINNELYGEMVGNFQFSMTYMAMTEIVICAYCYFTRSYRAFILVGFFLITLVGSLRFYSDVNDVSFDENLPLFFIYNGISHILFGAVTSTVKMPNPR